MEPVIVYFLFDDANNKDRPVLTVAEVRQVEEARERMDVRGRFFTLEEFTRRGEQ